MDRINWIDVGNEAAEILSRYVQLDTSNPPGNEEEAIRFLADILDREGISHEIITSEPGRCSIRARIPGDDPNGVILLSHADVVPADEKTPELGDEAAQSIEWVPAGGDYIVFKPLDQFTMSAPPDAVIIFGNADVMGAMITMANYARPGDDSVIVQFSSGCYSIITEPRLQLKNETPKAILGSFDIACRRYVDPCTMTFSAATNHMWEMAMDMKDSFLTVDSWRKIRGRKKRG